MLIDGNDERGIDVGLLTADHIAIRAVASHVDTLDPDRPGESLFSRDCPVYRLDVAGTELWVLVNHLKSQSFTFGNPDPLRTRQANQVRQVYDGLRADGIELIAVVGDLNKGPTNTTPPQHPTLEALLGPDSPLIDTHGMDVFDAGPRPGTFQSCGVRNRLDYILVSPELADRVTAGGINRKGLWGTLQTRTHPATGTSSRRSRTPSTPRPTTLPSGSTSTSREQSQDPCRYQCPISRGAHRLIHPEPAS